MGSTQGVTEPPVQSFAILDKYGVQVIFTGQHLGHGSSRIPHKPRWFEVDIYRDTVVDEYVVHTLGCTTVTGEEQRRRIVRADNADDVIGRLIVQHNGKVYLPRATRNALAQAAQWDDELATAYREREVE